MQTALKKWGNSLAIRIPNHILQSFQLKEGSILELTLEQNKIIIEKKQDLATLCQEITPSNLHTNPEWEDIPKGKEW